MNRVRTTCERLAIVPGERRTAVLDLFASARRSICLSLFRCDDERVLRALVDAAARGVDVRVLMTSRARRSQVALTQVRNYLSRQGVAVRRWTGASKYHAKFAVVDGDVALVSTGNYTKKAFARTLDFAVVTADAGVVRGLAALFTADWAGHHVPPLVTAAGPQGRLIIGPSHAPRRRFAALVRSARRHVRVLDAKCADRAMLNVVDDARAAGCAVDVRRESRIGGWRSHGKLLLIDDAVAVIGSIAWSRVALERRRELAIVIRDRSVVAQLHTFWQSLPAATRSVVVSPDEAAVA